jgi:hypothetical protein
MLLTAPDGPLCKVQRGWKTSWGVFPGHDRASVNRQVLGSSPSAGASFVLDASPLTCVGITVYGLVRRGWWRATWHENGKRRQREAASEEGLATKLEKVTEWHEAGYQVVHVTWKELFERPERVIDRILTAFRAASPY